MTAADLRGPGRPRSPERDDAITDATIEEYAERGFAGMSIEGVAARAGVGKATIYRRYASKLELVRAALEASADRSPVPDTGSVRADLRSLLAELHLAVQDPRRGGAMRQLPADTQRNPELSALHAAFVQRRRALYTTVLARGIERGEVRPDLDLELTVDLLTGPVFLRHLVTHGPLDAAYLDDLLDEVLRAIGA